MDKSVIKTHSRFGMINIAKESRFVLKKAKAKEGQGR
jgi:hypothetical protein